MKILKLTGWLLLVWTQRGFTPLHVAAKYGHLKVAEMLVNKGVDPNFDGKNGLTPLHVATHYNHVDIALFLLEKRANPHCATKVGLQRFATSTNKLANGLDCGDYIIKGGSVNVCGQ